MTVTSADVIFVKTNGITNRDPEERTVRLVGKYTDRKALLKRINKLFDTAESVATYVIKWSTESIMCKCDPDKFLQICTCENEN